MESYSFRLSFERRRMQQEGRRRCCWYPWRRHQEPQQSSQQHSSDPGVVVVSASNTNINSEGSSPNNILHRSSSSVQFATLQATEESSNTRTTNSSLNPPSGQRSGPTRQSTAGIRQSSVRRSQTREIHRQAVLYFLAFGFTFGFIFLAEIMEAILGRGNVPFAFYVLIDIFLPLQGVFNILVFMRPQVTKLRRRNPGYSYLKTLFVCLRNIDVSGSGGVRRGGSLRVSVRRSSRHLASVGKLNGCENRIDIKTRFTNMWKYLKGCYRAKDDVENTVGRRSSMRGMLEVEGVVRSGMENMDEQALFPVSQSGQSK